jgi:beta-1,4-mannosyltransferase
VAKIIAFPRDDIAYNECLYAAVKDLGVVVENGAWAGRWLHKNVAPGDLVHIHWPSFSYFDSGSRWQTYKNLARFCAVLALLRLRGARVVWTAHNLYPHEGGRGEWTHRFGRRVVIAAAEKIFAHGSSAKRILQTEFGIPPQKLIEVPHGNWIGYHPHTIGKAEARKTLGIDPATYVFCIVGACRPYKNIEGLIDAFRRIDGNCFLLIAGKFQSQEYQIRIEQLLAQLPSARFRLDAKFIATNEMQRYLVGSDALVLPYTEILTSGSAMLGLSFGIPVIAPNIGSLADVITNECGILYDVTTQDGLLQAMEQIRRQTYSTTAILNYARSFEWTKSAQALVEVLHETAGVKPGYRSGVTST